VYIFDSNTGMTVSAAKPCPSSSNGSITVTATGGSGKYEYSKNNGSTWQTSNVFSSLTAGTYQIAARSRNDCHTATQQVVLTNLITSAGNDTIQCSNVFTLAATPLATGETGKWTVVGTATGITFANDTQANTTATMTLAQRKTATLRWTLTNGQCSVYDDVNLEYRECVLPVNPHLRSQFKP